MHSNCTPAGVGRRRSDARAAATGCLFSLAAIALAGCSTPAVPALEPAPGIASANTISLHPSPTVAQLVDHIRCTLRSAIHSGLSDPATKDAFYKLIKYNFIATPELTVKVTNTEGLAPHWPLSTPRPR